MKIVTVPKMLPCPFCGRKPNKGQIVWKGFDSRFECCACGALGPFPRKTADYPKRSEPALYSNTEAKIRDREAAIAWNRRAK